MCFWMPGSTRVFDARSGYEVYHEGGRCRQGRKKPQLSRKKTRRAVNPWWLVCITNAAPTSVSTRTIAELAEKRASTIDLALAILLALMKSCFAWIMMMAFTVLLHTLRRLRWHLLTDWEIKLVRTSNEQCNSRTANILSIMTGSWCKNIAHEAQGHGFFSVARIPLSSLNGSCCHFLVSANDVGKNARWIVSAEYFSTSRTRWNQFLARTCLTTLWQITKSRIAPNFIAPATKRRILATAFAWRLPLYYRASLRDPWPCVRIRLARLTAHWKLTTLRIECFSLSHPPVVSRERQFPSSPRSQRCTLCSRYLHKNFQHAVKECCILLFLASI